MKKSITLLALAASLTFTSAIDRKVHPAIVAPPLTEVAPFYADPGIGDQTFTYFEMVPGLVYELHQGGEIYRFTWPEGSWNILLIIQHADQEPITLWEVSKFQGR